MPTVCHVVGLALYTYILAHLILTTPREVGCILPVFQMRKLRLIQGHRAGGEVVESGLTPIPPDTKSMLLVPLLAWGEAGGLVCQGLGGSLLGVRGGLEQHRKEDS